ncbi:YraN family protein [Algivirga pacifica]|uniref:UPF0102 protein GCM10023331_18460 n=1 Tax=Algivirga pacifica TaxID=1162670 RepID=A0ABP9DDK0_9BACT
MNNIEKGKKQEELASQYLEQKGHEIIDKNYRFGRNEIDLITHLNDILIFVEVKSRKSAIYGYPESSVTKRKQKGIQRAADAYLQQSDYQGRVRFDIIAIIDTGKSVAIEHFEDAF